MLLNVAFSELKMKKGKVVLTNRGSINKEKIINNITALKADTLLNVKEAAQKNELIAQLSALNTKINVLTTEGRLKTLEEINAINTAEGRR